MQEWQYSEEFSIIIAPLKVRFLENEAVHIV